MKLSNRIHRFLVNGVQIKLACLNVFIWAAVSIAWESAWYHGIFLVSLIYLFTILVVVIYDFTYGELSPICEGCEIEICDESEAENCRAEGGNPPDVT